MDMCSLSLSLTHSEFLGIENVCKCCCLRSSTAPMPVSVPMLVLRRESWLRFILIISTFYVVSFLNMKIARKSQIKLAVKPILSEWRTWFNSAQQKHTHTHTASLRFAAHNEIRIVCLLFCLNYTCNYATITALNVVQYACLKWLNISSIFRIVSIAR